MTDHHRIDAVDRWSPPRWAALREVLALWRVLLSLRRATPNPPAGDPVLLLPGFLAGDWSLRPTARYLRRRGYRTYAVGIRANVGCTGATVDRIERRVTALSSELGPLTLVGHSRGGTLARLVAGRQPGSVRHVVTLGSPLTHQFAASRHILGVAELLARLNRHGSPALLDARCLRGDCAEEVGAALSAPLPETVALTSIYSHGDGIVPWRACLTPGAERIGVRGSHNGLASNRGALAATVRALRRPARHSHPTTPPAPPARAATPAPSITDVQWRTPR